MLVAVVQNFVVVVNNSGLVCRVVIEPRRDLYSMNKLVPDQLEMVEVELQLAVVVDNQQIQHSEAEESQGNHYSLEELMGFCCYRAGIERKNCSAVEIHWIRH